MPRMERRSDYKAAWLMAWGNSSTALRDFENDWNAKVDAYNTQYDAADAPERAELDARLLVVTDAADAAQRDYATARAELARWSASAPALPAVQARHARRRAQDAVRQPLDDADQRAGLLLPELAEPLKARLALLRATFAAEDSTLEALQALPAQLAALTGAFETAEADQASRPEREADAKLILRSLDQWPMPAAWTGPVADAARRQLDELRKLLQAPPGVPPSEAELADARVRYDEFTATRERAAQAHAQAEQLAQARSSAERLLADIDERLEGLRTDLATGFKARLAGPRKTLAKANASLQDLEQAHAQMQPVDAESLAFKLEDADVARIAQHVGSAALPAGATAAHARDFEQLRAAKLAELRTAPLLQARRAQAELDALAQRIAADVKATRERLQAELQRLATAGKGSGLDEKQAAALAATMPLDELLALEASVGLAALGALNEAFAPDGAEPGSVAGVKGFQDFVAQGLGGDAALKTLLADGCKGDVKKLAAFGKAFRSPADQAGLARLLGVGAGDDKPTGRLAAGTVATLLQACCDGDAAMFKALNQDLLADTPEAAAGRERQRNLLEGGGLAEAPAVLKGLLPPGKTSGDELGREMATLLGGLGQAFDGEAGAAQFKALLESGFVPNTKAAPDRQVKPDCLGRLLRDGLGGDAGELAALAQGVDSGELVARRKALRARQQQLQQKLKGTEKLDAKQKAELEKEQKKVDREFAEADAAVKLRQENRFGKLLTEAGLGRHPEVLAQAVKTGCGGKADRLLALSGGFDDYASRNGLRIAVEEGGLGGGAGESPELLGDVIGHGLGGDGAKLKAMVTAFGAKPGQLKEMIGLYKEPPHGPPPGGPGRQIEALLKPRLLNGDAALLQTRFTANLASLPEDRRKAVLNRAPEFQREPTGKKDDEAVAGAAQAASGKTTMRLDHFAQRHAAANFDFGDIKKNNSQWPAGTGPAQVKAYAEQALAAWTTAPQVDLGATKKVMLLDLGGGKSVAVQVAWNGAKLSQFVPLTRDKAASVGLVVDAADYLEGLDNFSKSEMERLKAALLP